MSHRLQKSASTSRLTSESSSTNAVQTLLLTIIRRSQLTEVYPSLDIVLCIYLTLMVINCSIERSFSCLKRIKNYLRSSLSQDKVTNLSLLCIESSALNTIVIINDFSRLKARRNPMWRTRHTMNTYIYTNNCTLLATWVLIQCFLSPSFLFCKCLISLYHARNAFICLSLRLRRNILYIGAADVVTAQGRQKVKYASGYPYLWSKWIWFHFHSTNVSNVSQPSSKK
jgi:hypothetical protein